MKITRFEDLEVWKSAREIVDKIYYITNEGKFKMDFGLRDQIRRASVSIMSNIAEGFGRFSNKEFIQFLNIAKASATEVKSQLYISLDQRYISVDEFNSIYEKLEECSKMCSGLIKHLLNHMNT